MPFTGGMLAVSLASAYAANRAQSNAAKQANDLASQAMGQYTQLGLPPDESARLVIKDFKSAGKLTPELEEAILQQHAATASTRADQLSIDAQKGALAQYQALSKTGLSPIERAQISRIQNQGNQAEQSKQQQIIQGMQQRGQGGSGAELAAALNSSQMGAQNVSDQNIQIGGINAQAKLEALKEAAGLGGTMRTQSFGEEETRDKATDILRQFNITNQRDVQQRNVGSRNTAQELNLRNDQDIANRNVAQTNEETQRQSNARRQFWLDKSGLATAQANQLNNAATRATEQGQQKAASWNQAGQSIAGGISGIGANSARVAQQNIVNDQNQQLINLRQQQQFPLTQTNNNYNWS